MENVSFPPKGATRWRCANCGRLVLLDIGRLHNIFQILVHGLLMIDTYIQYDTEKLFPSLLLSMLK